MIRREEEEEEEGAPSSSTWYIYTRGADNESASLDHHLDGEADQKFSTFSRSVGRSSSSSSSSVFNQSKVRLALSCPSERIDFRAAVQIFDCQFRLSFSKKWRGDESFGGGL